MKHLDKDKSNLIFHDNHIVVALKKKGELCQPSPLKKISLETDLQAFFCKKEKKQKVFLHAVHRLDKDVSGLVLFAKSSKALSRLTKQMREGQFIKIYLAHVKGKVKKEKGKYIDFLVHKSHRAQVVLKEDPQGKRCELLYKVRQRYKTSTLLEIQLITGRYHQIRCQLAHHKHPILGDRKYGGPKIPILGIALHQAKLSFLHPITQERLYFEDVPQFEWHLEQHP